MIENERSKVPFVGNESILCHDCRNDTEQALSAGALDQLCPLDINETRTCARCHEQRGVWWFIELGSKKGRNESESRESA